MEREKDREGALAESVSLTREQIKAALAREYGAAQATGKVLMKQAQEELFEREDIEAYKYNCKQAEIMLHYAGGIQAAAETLGISKGELTTEADRTAGGTV